MCLLRWLTSIGASWVISQKHYININFSGRIPGGRTPGKDLFFRPQKDYRSSKWHYRQRKNILEIIVHFVADTDTDEDYFGMNFSVADADTVVLCKFEGSA